MASSILRFKRAVPWQAIALLAIAGLAWVLSALYTLFLNPEVAFYVHGHKIKSAWAQKLNNEYSQKIVMCGGSSCATQIDGQRMLEQHGVPLLNLGLAAGMGAKVLARYGQASVRPGDTLIVALEPELLAGSLEVPYLGGQFSFATDQLELLSERRVKAWFDAISFLRPGAYHLFTRLGKIAMRRPVYPYQKDDYRPGGWHRVEFKTAFESGQLPAGKLSEEGRAWLKSVHDWCRQRQVRVAYALPWMYFPPDRQRASREVNMEFIRQVAGVMPVLRDASFGIKPEREWFSNTHLHLTPEGAAHRTDDLSRLIKVWEVWARDELDPNLPARK